MKIIFLFDYLIVQITIIHALNKYLGCFIDQIGNRDLNIFINDYDQLTPKQCIHVCREQNFLYAAIQYGTECRCGKQYGKYGQASDDECDYLCSTTEKCGGDNRNSVYSVIDSIDTDLDLTCQNNFVGYEGCFNSLTLKIEMNIVNSIEECIKYCSMNYNYAKITNGNICYCGNELNFPLVNSNLCNIPCNKNFNSMTPNCCGGHNVFSVYNIKTYQSSLIKDLSEKINRATNDSTHISTQTTYTNSKSIVLTSAYLNNSTLSTNVSVETITSQPIITINRSLPISSTTFTSIISTLFNSRTANSSNKNINQSILFTTNRINDIFTSMMSRMTSTIPISTTNIVGSRIMTSHLSTSTTPTLRSTSTLVIINIPSTTPSTITTVSQSSTYRMNTIISSARSSSMNSIISNAITSSSSHSYINNNILSSTRTNIVTAESTPSIRFTSQSNHRANIGTNSSSYTISNQTSFRIDTIISRNPITSISSTNLITSNTLSTTLTSIHTNTIQSITSSPTTRFSSIDASSSMSLLNTISSLTSTMRNILNSPQFALTASTHLPQTSSISTSPNPISFNSIKSNSSSNFSTIITTAFHNASTIAFSSHTDITVETTVSTQSTTLSTVAITNTSNLSTISNQTISSTLNSTTVSTPQTTTVSLSNVISTILIIPSNQNFTPNDNNTRESIRQGLKRVINLAFYCVNNPSDSNCMVVRERIKRQSNSDNYDVNLVSSITEISNTPSRRYSTDYTVNPLNNPNTLISPTQVRIALRSLQPSVITRLLGYDYDGDFIRSTNIVSRDNPTSDRKLWLIGAILGPIAFVLLLIFVFCYLHYKCRPRPANQLAAKPIYHAPQLSARSTNYTPISNGSITEKPKTEKGIRIITQNDPLAGVTTPSQRVLTPTESDKSSNHTPQYPLSIDVPMDEIRRQNDVERWRNKLRLNEKFSQSSIDLPDSSVPNTNRSTPYQYNNRVFEHDPSTINIQPASEIISTDSPRRTRPTTQIEVGRTKLHRLLDEVLDKADSEDGYNPDSQNERQKRRRQRRRVNSISEDPTNLFTKNNNQQIPHIPVIPQVSERPDPSFLRLHHNPYEAGDRAHDISRLPPVRLEPKYETDDQRYNQYSSRSNPSLFYDDSIIADRAATATNTYANPKRLAKTRLETDREAAMRHNDGQIKQRQHKFNDDAVYIDKISKNQDEYRVQAHTAWINSEINDEAVRKPDYHNEYMMAKRSVANTKNIISSIHDELGHVITPSSKTYHA